MCAGPILLALTVVVNFRAVRVDGESMSPSLRAGDVLFVDCRATAPTPLAIYMLSVEGERLNPILKRLVGLPGQRLEADRGRLYADGQEVHPRLTGAPQEWNDVRPVYVHGRLEAALSLESGEHFFLGDNPRESRDSRHFGPVRPEAVTGRVIWRLRGPGGYGPVE
jgi:signal peptidase I